MQKRGSMRKIIILLVFMLVIDSAYATPFATIANTGLSFVDPRIATAVQTIMCASVAGVVQCATQFVERKVVGAVYGQLFEQIARASPEAARAISMHNQVKSYLDSGANIINELQINNNGQLEIGSIEFKELGGEIGNLIGDLDPHEIIVSSSITLDKKDDISTLTFIGESSSAIIKDNPFDNIKPKDEVTNAFIKLDDQGEIIEADFTTNEQGSSYVIGNDRIDVPPNSRVVFKDEKV